MSFLCRLMRADFASFLAFRLLFFFVLWMYISESTSPKAYGRTQDDRIPRTLSPPSGLRRVTYFYERTQMASSFHQQQCSVHSPCRVLLQHGIRAAITALYVSRSHLFAERHSHGGCMPSNTRGCKHCFGDPLIFCVILAVAYSIRQSPLQTHSNFVVFGLTAAKFIMYPQWNPGTLLPPPLCGFSSRTPCVAYILRRDKNSAMPVRFPAILA